MAEHLSPLLKDHVLFSTIHPSLNKDLIGNLNKVTIAAKNKIWWRCDKYSDHAWLASVRSRIVNNVGCQICSGKVSLEGFNDIQTTHPNLVKEWHPTKNISIDPRTITNRYSKKVWWKCEKGHEYEALVSDRANRKRGCSVCRGLKIVPGVNDFFTTHPDLAKQVHPTKNPNFSVTEVVAGTERKIWWLGECGHEWYMAIDKRTTRNQGCSVCAGKQVVLETSIIATHSSLAAEWHPTKNGDLKPGMVSAGSHKKVWWLGQCGHEWESVVKSRALSNHNCPICAGKQVMIGFNDLQSQFANIAAEWHPTKNGNLTPSQLTHGSGQKVWWKCAEGHEWICSIGNRTNLKSNCPECYNPISRGEEEILDYVRSLGFSPIKTSSILGRKEIDIYIPEKKIAIEFNGLYWHTEKAGKTQYYHYDKWKKAKEQGIQLIHVWEDDWKSKSELLKRMIAYKLGVSDAEKYFARKLTIDTNVSISEAREFLTYNHLQGFRISSKYIGLRTPENKLVALLTVLYKKNGNAEITRFATSGTVVGGFSKLLKQIPILNIETKQVTSYSHNDHSLGDVYEKNGFILVSEGKPGYSYFIGGNRREHRLQYTKKRFRDDPKLSHSEDKTERELANDNGLTRIWDSGSSLWELKKA